MRCVLHSLALGEVLLKLRVAFDCFRLLDPRSFEVLQIDEPLCRRQRLFDGSGVGHHRDHLFNSLKIDLALFGQDATIGFQV